MGTTTGTTVRLFVAGYPPAGVVEGYIDFVRGLGLPDHRETPADQVHLTLQFIGQTQTRDLGRVTESVARSVSGIGAFKVRPSRLLSLPGRGAARVVALELEAPSEVYELHRRLSHRLTRRTRKDATDRFVPHLTLCRFRRPAAGLRVEEVVGFAPFEIGEARLMRSVLRPDGAEHRLVQVFGLVG